MPFMLCDPPSGDNFEPIIAGLTVENVVFSSSGLTQRQDGGFDVSVPGLSATWDASTNPYVTGVEFEYTPTSFTGETKKSAAQAIGRLQWTTTDGILPQAVYDCRYRAVGINGAFGEWSSPAVPVTISADFSGLAGADGVLTTSDIIEFLKILKLNLWPFGVFSFSGGAAAVDPFTDPPVTGAEGAQLRAISFPGGSATPKAKVTTKDYGGATADGAAYNISFKAWLEGGGTSGSLKAGFRDVSNAAISDLADQTYAVTATPTVFTWLHIASDDPDFAAAPPNNPYFQFFVSGSSDIPAGSTLFITEFQIQLDDYWTPRPIDLPWRPNMDEDNLLAYAPYLVTLNKDELINKPDQRVVSGPQGGGTVLAPMGLLKRIPATGTTYAIDGTESGKVVVCSNPSGCVVTFTPESTHGLAPMSLVTVRWGPGAGPVSTAAGVGVTINPRRGGLTLDGEGDFAQFSYNGSDEWDMY